jgi:glutaminase
MMQSAGTLCQTEGAVALYTRQCSLNVSARAVMRATLTDGGFNPVNGSRVVKASVCPLRPGCHGDGGPL